MLPAFWVLLSLRYTSYSKLTPKWFNPALFVIPFITLVLHYTNEYHHLYYSSLSVNNAGPFPLAAIGKGPWYYVHVLFINICTLAGNILFYLMMLNSAGPFRKQAAIMFIASLFPWIANIVYQAGLTPFGIDIVPFVLAVITPVLGLGLFRYRLFELAPIARDTVFEVIEDPVVVLDNRNRLADFNQAAARIFPTLESRKIGMPIEGILNGHAGLREFIQRRDEGPREIEIRSGDTLRCFDARLTAISAAGKAADGEDGALVIFHDITGKKLLLDQLEELATRDSLTSVFNRRRFIELYGEEMDRARRYGRPCSLILIDLDDFKLINDTHGHQAGDSVLGNAAAVFRNGLRSSDVLGRYGGEEFAVLLPETDPKTAAEIAERLRKNLEQSPTSHEGLSISITASFGVAGLSRPDPGITSEKLLSRADEALYLAKRKGRNLVERL